MPDVNQLVEAYAKATATVGASAVTKAGSPPPDADAILNLTPPEQAQAALLLMRRIAKVRQQQKGFFIWWNYVAAAEVHTRTQGASPALKKELRRLLRMLQDISEDRRIRRGIDSILAA